MSATRKIHVANPSDKSWTRGRYLLWFGAHSATFVLAYANDLDSALEESAELLSREAPGLFVEPDYEHAENRPCEYVCGSCNLCMRHAEDAEADLTHTESGYLASWEWGIVLENPSREFIISFHRGGGLT